MEKKKIFIILACEEREPESVEVGRLLKEKYGKDFKEIPYGALGLYTYIDRLTHGLQQMMAGARKFALNYIDRSDICALTREAAEMSGITYVMESDREEVDKILK